MRSSRTILFHRFSLLPALLPILLTASIFVSPVVAQAVQADAQSASLSLKERLFVFDRVWRLVNDRYYDPAFNGADWKAVRRRYQLRIAAAHSDEAFYDQLEQMVRELHDAHTRVLDPWKKRLRDKSQTVSVGIMLSEIEGQPTVIGVDLADVPARLGVQPGMILRTIDGQAVAARLSELREQIGTSSSERATRLLIYFKLLDGQPGTSAKLTFARTDATGQAIESGSALSMISVISVISVPAMRHLVPAEAEVAARTLPSGFGYLQLSRWKQPAPALIREALEKLRNAPGLIIDLRGNGGGEVRVVAEISSYFFAGKTSLGRFIKRSGKPVEITAGREGGQRYSGPLIILVNEASGSGSELFSAALQDNGRAVIVGQQTCGCVLAAAREKLPGGGELNLSVFDYRSPRGRRLEGDGVIPDQVIPLKLADLRQHRDPALAEAEKILQEQSAAKLKATRAAR